MIWNPWKALRRVTGMLEFSDRVVSIQRREAHKYQAIILDLRAKNQALTVELAKPMPSSQAVHKARKALAAQKLEDLKAGK